MLTGKTILLGVSGCIAAYKAAALASLIVKQGANLQVVMTKNGTEFVSPLTFEALSENKVAVDTFDRNFQYSTEHIALAKQADLVMIAPATANIIAKLANGMADDMLTTTVLACRCPKLIAPAMNTAMYENQVTQDNLQRLKDYGWQVIDPCSGRLACGDVGAGKMAGPEMLLEAILQEAAYEKDMAGLKVLVTAGPTMEAIDPVRFISNHSTGKMGYAVARAAAQRGAQVTLITGKTALPRPSYMNIVEVTSAQEMFEAVTAGAHAQDVIIKAAAVADYKPAQVGAEKIKKQEGQETMAMALSRTQDILKYLGEHRREGQFICGFSMETENLLANSRMKLAGKNVDMIACNSLKDPGSAFAGDTNQLTLITSKDEIILPLMDKEKAAHELLSAIMDRR